jgi:hypothetical protein
MTRSKEQTDWRDGFGTLDEKEAEELEQAVETTNCGHRSEQHN